MPKRIKHQPLAIGRSNRATNHVYIKFIRVQVLFESNNIGYMLLYIAGKGNFASYVNAIYIHLHDLATAPYDDLPIIRSPCKTSIYPENGPGLLLVLGELVIYRPLFPCFQVAQK